MNHNHIYLTNEDLHKIEQKIKNFSHNEYLKEITRYNNSKDDEDKFRSVSIELWERGLLHQPRKFGAHPRRRPEIWLEAVLPNSELEKNPAAKAAWDKFQMIAGLTNVELDKEYK